MDSENRIQLKKLFLKTYFDAKAFMHTLLNSRQFIPIHCKTADRPFIVMTITTINRRSVTTR